MDSIVLSSILRNSCAQAVSRTGTAISHRPTEEGQVASCLSDEMIRGGPLLQLWTIRWSAARSGALVSTYGFGQAPRGSSICLQDEQGYDGEDKSALPAVRHTKARGGYRFRHTRLD